ncbi:15.7 kDa [Spodoptera frugiperda ascovirus 1a]|uniref:15.7 kDa n=1 Tax=Spodoptera frugiperda ascovirus 1a TaxID=113370 RepID=Q0E501_SFAVA|nr:15.7 kDa [Spodoptera frugiperda ascovirus 1a]CAL44700.1 15.7 kDa [Spodoptera frugiperda ascovirus 1a]
MESMFHITIGGGPRVLFQCDYRESNTVGAIFTHRYTPVPIFRKDLRRVQRPHRCTLHLYVEIEPKRRSFGGYFGEVRNTLKTGARIRHQEIALLHIVETILAGGNTDGTVDSRQSHHVGVLSHADFLRTFLRCMSF